MFRHNRLFWKIFLWFWLSMVSVMMSLTFALSMLVDPADILPERLALFGELEAVGRVLERLPGDRFEVLDTLTSWHASRGFRNTVHVFDETGRALGVREPPRSLRDFFRETRDTTEYRIAVRDGQVLLGPYRLKREGAEYLSYLVKSKPTHVLHKLWRLLSHEPSVFLVLLAVSGALCFILTAYLVAPIRELRAAVRRINEGRLDAAVSASVVSRRDEIGQLGQDFNRMAERLNRLVSAQQRLLRDVSHELRSPLTRMSIAMGLARRKGAGNADGEYERIEQEITRLDGLIGQILRWSRLSDGAEGASAGSLELAGLLAQLVEDADFEARAAGKRVQLAHSETCWINAAEPVLVSALENIVRNGIRHAPEHGTVEVRLCAGAGKGAVIDVRDRGPGVPEEHLASIFEPFFRILEASASGRAPGGSGLGLAIAKRAVEMCGGAVRAENCSPGLRVVVTLPLSARASAP